MLLRRKAVAVADGTRAGIAAVGFEHSCFAGIREIRRQDFGANAFSELLVLYRVKHFDTGVKITWHPIGAAEIKVGRAAVFEIEDAAMFEKATNDAANTDTTADAAQPRNERTLAADNQIDLHARLRCAVKRLNHGR